MWAWLACRLIVQKMKLQSVFAFVLLLGHSVSGQRASPSPRPSIPADAGAERFPGPSRCLGGDGTPGRIISCLSQLRACSTRVTVVASGGEDCSQLQQDQLDGRSCSRLEDVLRIIECPGCEDMGPACQTSSEDCIEVLLQPTPADQGPHTVIARERRCIRQNVVLTGLSSQVSGWLYVVAPCMHQPSSATLCVWIFHLLHAWMLMACF